MVLMLFVESVLMVGEFMDPADILCVYIANHDPNVTFMDKDGRIRTFEYERFVNAKFAQFWPDKPDERIDYINFFKLIKRHQLKEPKTIFVLGKDRVNGELWAELFPNAKIEKALRHHLAHAACAYYQAPLEFRKSLVFTYDGMGFNYNQPHNAHLYLFNNGEYEFLKTPKLIEWGRPYGDFGRSLRQLKPDGTASSFIYSSSEMAAGKFMGYCGYGKWDQAGVDKIKSFLQNNIFKWSAARKETKNFYSPLYHKHGRDKVKKFAKSLDPAEDRYWAACYQEAFTQLVLEFLLPEIEKHRVNVILVGGCALNVLTNQRLQEAIEPWGLKLFLCPNANDSGLSLGEFYLNCPPEQGQVVTYSGLPMLDKIEDFIPKDFPISTTADIVSILAEGSIVGCADGDSEVGPRALGNRSILCLPTKGMKDKINAQIKSREWWRPFAPVCRLEDKDKFFDNAYESPYMSFAPTVKEEYKEALCDVTHVDGTTRLQTVTLSQHSFLYELLTEMEKSGLIPVLLNTSFNIRGEPILTKYEIAIRALKKTQLDYIYLDKRYLCKKTDFK